MGRAVATYVWAYSQKEQGVSTLSTARERLERRKTGTTWLAKLREPTLKGIARREALTGYLFVAPTLLGILVFSAGPVIASLGLSFFSWNVFSPAQLVGFANYQRLFGDTRVLISFANTLRLVLALVLLELLCALLLAMALEGTRPAWLRYFFRTAFFFPLLMSGAAAAIAWSYMLHKEFGVVNYYLGLLWIPKIPWLASARWALPAIVIVYIWRQAGFYMVLFMGGLSNMPQEVLDAARVDGATGWRRLWHIVLPLLSPTVFFAAIIGVIGALQLFDEPYIMTRGGPGDATRTAVMTMYEAAFKNLELGYGSAIALLLFVLILVVTLTQFWAGERFVFYQ